MSVVIFILGRPGSGKSCAYRHIAKLARRRNLSVCRINDYDILYLMFRNDIEYKQFYPLYNKKGFDILDKEVYDTALKKAALVVLNEKERTDIVVVEFARDNYGKALQHFPLELLQKSYFLFIDTDVEVCIQRIRNRIKTYPPTSDDYFVSPEILETDYKKQYIPDLTKKYGIEKKRWMIFKNNGPRDTFDTKVDYFVNHIPFQKEYTNSFFVLTSMITKFFVKLANVIFTCLINTCNIHTIKQRIKTSPLLVLSTLIIILICTVFLMPEFRYNTEVIIEIFLKRQQAKFLVIFFMCCSYLTLFLLFLGLIFLHKPQASRNHLKNKKIRRSKLCQQ